MTHSHFVHRCKHGVVVMQCRCIGPKPERVVGCPKWCKEGGVTNMTQEQIEREFRRQIDLCSGIGWERMRELLDEATQQNPYKEKPFGERIAEMANLPKPRRP